MGALIGGMIVLVIGRFFASPLLARRHYRKYKAIQQDLAVELAENGIRFFAPTGEVIVTWDQIYKWRQNATFVLIYPMPRLFHIIPCSVVAQGFDLQALTDALVAHVGKPE